MNTFYLLQLICLFKARIVVDFFSLLKKTADGYFIILDRLLYENFKLVLPFLNSGWSLNFRLNLK